MQGRYQTLRDRTFSAEFYAMDCYSVSLFTVNVQYKKQLTIILGINRT